MADITVKAAYGSVVEDEGFLFIGFAEGEEEEEGYVLFRQPVDGGPVWFEVNDEGFGAEEAVDCVTSGPKGIEIALKPDMAAKFGWATSVAVRIGPGTEDASEALEALAQMLGARWQGYKGQHMSLSDDLVAVIGAANVLTGTDLARYGRDWMGWYEGAPIAVARPGSTDEVAACLRIAASHKLPVVPISGNTGLVGGTHTDGGLMISLERLNRIRAVKREAKLVVAEAGVILSRLHDAAEAEGLYFPLWFGARGSAMLGGALSTNAGGSNVLRYGSTRGLCLGLEVVLADGRVLNLMSELHKDNSGYDLKSLFIGAEGTLGIITAAVMKLVPAPRAHATAVLAVRSLADALVLLNRMQEATGGRVEAFEFMPRTYSERLQVVRPDLGLPFDHIPEVTILIEVATTVPAEAAPDDTGEIPLVAVLEGVLAEMIEAGLITDAVLARSEAQRRAIWARREAAAEIAVGLVPEVDTDVAVPLDKVEVFLTEALRRLEAMDPGARTLTVAHMGDGNLHFAAYPTRDDDGLKDRVREMVEDIVQDLGGSFSAEHGVGLSKLPSMRRRKDPVALEVMRSIKAALDPEGRMNPGKVIPD